MIRLNEVSALRRVALTPPSHAFGDPSRIAREWRTLNFTAAPDLGRAEAQYAELVGILVSGGAQVDEIRPTERLTLDCLYVRDASVLTPAGIVLASMGKPARQGEPEAHRRAFEALGLPIAGVIVAPGRLEGGDVVWFDERTVAVGRGYRTNDEGIRQFRALLGAEVDVLVVPLPHYRGPDDVFHLMSIVSPIDRDLAVVYSPLLPVPFLEWLTGRGFGLLDVPHEEFDSMAANVLALSPRRVVLLEGNPMTRARLEAAGAEVLTYDGTDISLKGGGGPTCLTRPLIRADDQGDSTP
ncbi:MAG: amidinotransferase [Acidobacteria bacterium]|nr:amidinotransferase [Acidobacteriota bacterium]